MEKLALDVGVIVGDLAQLVDPTLRDHLPRFTNLLDNGERRQENHGFLAAEGRGADHRRGSGQERLEEGLVHRVAGIALEVGAVHREHALQVASLRLNEGSVKRRGAVQSRSSNFCVGMSV